jgi:hypothetical protein
MLRTVVEEVQMDRSFRRAANVRNGWGQVGLSACILLLPPIIVGAAIHIKLAARDGTPYASAPRIGLSQAAAATAFTVQAVVPTRGEPAPSPPDPGRVAALPQLLVLPATPAAPPLAAANPTAVPSKPTSAASSAPVLARSGPAPDPVEAGHLLGPVPVRVTVVVAPRESHADDAPPPAQEASSPAAELPPTSQFLPSAEALVPTGTLLRLRRYVRNHARQHGNSKHSAAR